MDAVNRITVPTPFEVGRVNCYVFSRNGLTLLDPGPATEEAYEELAAGLNEYGHALADVERVLITHPHMDHFGLANRIKTDADATVVAHTDATHRLENPLSYFHREEAFFEPFLLSMGVPDRLVGTVVGLAEPYLDFQEAVSIDRELADGDVVDGGTDLRVVHTPGHAPGSVCFVSMENDAAFTGDHVLSEISPNPLLTLAPNGLNDRTRSLPEYIASLRTLRSVGVTTGYGGHRSLITDLPRRIDEIQNHHLDRKERIGEMLDEEGAMTAYRIMQEMFPNLPTTEMFPGMSEVIGHLDLLEDEGRIDITESDGVRRYTRN